MNINTFHFFVKRKNRFLLLRGEFYRLRIFSVFLPCLQILLLGAFHTLSPAVQTIIGCIAVLVKAFCIGSSQYQLSGRSIKIIHFDAVSGGHVEPGSSDADRICGSLT